MTSAAPPPHPPAQYAPHPSSQDPAAPRPARIFATLALIAAVAELLVGVGVTVAQVLLIRSESISLIGGVSAVMGALGIVLALLAIVFAGISIARREPARVLAGAAIGVGVAGIVATLSGLLQSALLSVI